MRYGSVCSGIEAASVAWRPLGWECAFVSEIEKFPAAVLAERYPQVPNLGDFTKISRADYAGDIDLLVGGTPCQAFSIAGLRKGLQDERGNLALEFARLAFRANARWVVWENVPGVLSSGKGRDFAAFLSLLAGWEVPVPADGKWRKAGLVTAAPGCFSVGWRILDAQYTRVQQFPRAIPQRRKRVLLVGSLASWTDCAKVLFDGEMRGGTLPPRRETGQKPAADPQGRVGRDVGTEGLKEHVVDTRFQTVYPSDVAPSLLASDYKEPKALLNEVCPTLDASYPGKMNFHDMEKLVCYENHPQDGRVRETDGVSPSIPAQAGTGGNNLPLVQHVRGAAVAIAETAIGRKAENGGHGLGVREEVSYTLDTTDVHGVCYPIDMTNVDGRQTNPLGPGFGKDGTAAYPLTRRRPSGVCLQGIIRRLLPVECERLMGFPDGWTLIPWRGKAKEECPDGPRYKALGNSMCTNVMAWIGERIDAVEKEKADGRKES